MKNKLIILFMVFVGLFPTSIYVKANINSATNKEQLLEETLYSRYHSYLDKTYFDFILCPKIDKIERIEGDIRRHKVYASALNYDGHHGDVPYDRIHITLTDTPEKGVKINKVTIQKGISEKESLIQCGKGN